MINGLIIPEYKKIVPDAFHGTSYDDAQKIEREQKFEPSYGDNHYLGDGVYFFENSKRSAEIWAIKFKKFEKYGILKAEINLGKCLDLNNEEHTRYLSKVEVHLRKRNLNDISDGYLVNATAKILDPDTIRWTYVKDKYGKLYKGSRFFQSSQLIICVRNVKNIISVYLVKGAFSDAR